jgi:hypothetical protein
MPCIIATGRALPCKEVVGGIQKVFIANQGTVGKATITAGVITAFAAPGTFDLYQFDVKSASGLEQTITTSTDNGTTFFTQTLTLVLTKLDPLTNALLDTLIKTRPTIFVLDNNGNYLSVGLTRGCEVNGTISGGVALGDMNGYSLTITADEPMMSQFVTAGLITGNIKATAGSPTQINPSA